MTDNEMILTDWDDICDALATGFTGSVVLTNRTEARGNVSPCDVVGGARTGDFDAVTVSSTHSGRFVRIRTVDILAVVVRDI